MELAVLRSGGALIDVHRPLLYVEVFTDQLARYGTTVADLDPFLTARRYVFFRNGGPRNSTSDDFAISYLPRLADGGPFLRLPRRPTRAHLRRACPRCRTRATACARRPASRGRPARADTSSLSEITRAAVRIR
jgi:hypothetical protein